MVKKKDSGPDKMDFAERESERNYFSLRYLKVKFSDEKRHKKCKDVQLILRM